MNAAVVARYGPPEVVSITQVPKPVPRDNEILIRIRATTVNSGDTRLRALRVPAGLGPIVRWQMGVFGPRQPVLGFELAGDVEAVGKDVTRFKPGDRVFGSPGFEFGCHAEYRCLAEDGAVALIPDGLDYAGAVALCFGGITALTFFRCADLKRGETILINGASGAVGTSAIQIARHFGAEVTAVCSTANIDLVKSLGADRVVDYTKTDFLESGETFDLVMDNVGNAPYAKAKRLLKPGGRFLMVIGNLSQMIEGAFNTRIINGEEKKDEGVFTVGAYRLLAELAEAGELKPVIDRTYPFEEIVEAHRYVDAGHKKGSVVLTLG